MWERQTFSLAARKGIGHHALMRTLKDVIEAAGGKAALARHLGLDRTTLYSWSAVPAHHLPRVAALAGIPMEDIRPDLFPEGKRRSAG